MENKRFNLIGFDRYKIDNKTYRHCSIHPYKRLLASKTDPDLLFCPECGSEYPVNDTIKEQDVLTDVPPSGNSNSGTKIISARKKRKYYDSFGALIPDDDFDALHDMQGGRRIVYYREDKVNE
jgi:hypothetical protein